MEHKPISKRRAVNLSLDEATVSAAREFGIGLSQVCNRALAAEVKREQERRWVEEHRPAMETWNAWFEENGMPFEDLRVF